MKCQRCNSERILFAGCKCSDMFGASIGSLQIGGYVPNDLGIGGGDYLEIGLCLDCGQLQGKFPLPISRVEQDISDEELGEFFEEYFCEGEYIVNIFASRRIQIINSSRDINYKLGNYIRDMFNYCGDIYSKSRIPSMKTFIEMYKKGSYDYESTR